MNTIVMANIFCLFFSSPSFYLSKQRKKTVCKHSKVVVQESNKNNIDPYMLAALIYVESGWKKTAVSKANACGLTQVLPRYTGGIAIKKKYTCEQLKNPKTSISAGATILKWWINYHKGKITQKQKNKMSLEDIEKYSLTRGLCGYNAGFRCGGKKPNKAGMRYARKVLKIKNRILNYSK